MALDKVVNANAAPGDRRWFDLEAVYPDSAVLCIDGRYWSYPYTLENGVVALQAAVEVIEPMCRCVSRRRAIQEGLLRLVESEGQPAGVVADATLTCMASASTMCSTPMRCCASQRRCSMASASACCSTPALERIAADLREVVGWWMRRAVEGVAPDTGSHRQRRCLPGLPEHTRSLLVGAIAAGKHDLAGLSIDARAKGSMRVMEGKKVKVPSALTRVVSVDLIVEPGAGGRLIRPVESAPANPDPEGDRDMKLREKMLRLIEAKNPASRSRSIRRRSRMTIWRRLSTGNVLADQAPPNVSALADQVEQRLRSIESCATAQRHCCFGNSPAAAKDRLQRDFAVRESFSDADVAAAIDGERQYLGASLNPAMYA